MSSFAEEKVKKYIKSNLTRFFRIRVAQMIHLRCFTDIDRQEISAYCNLNGNNRAVLEFFERLQSREGWLQILIEALEEDNLGDLANELQQVYNMYQPRNALPNSSSPAVGNIPPSMGSGAVGVCLPAPAEQKPSTPCDLPSSRGAQPSPHLPPKSPGAASLTAEPVLPEMSNYHVPVQETDLPSQNSKMVAEPKGTHSARNLESSTSPMSSVPSPSKSREPAGKEKPVNAQAPSATSTSHAFLEQDHLGKMPEDALLGTPPSVSSKSDISSSTQKWDSHQHRPVCVKNGYFGNVSRVAVDTGTSPTLVTPLGPKRSGNVPVEDYYSSSDSPPSAAPSSQDDSQEEERLGEQKTQARQGYQKKGVLGDSREVDSSAFSLQRRLDVGQEGAVDQRTNSPTVREKDDGETPGVVSVVGRSQNFQERGDHVPAEAASWLPSSAPLRGNSVSSPSQQTWSPPENMLVSPDPTTVPPKLSRPPPSDFEGSSSTDVIPPNSHTELSTSPSRVDLEDLKAPIQEEKWPAGELDDTHVASKVQEMVSVTQPSGIADESTVNSRKRRNGCSRWDNRVFHSYCDDDSLCKPGVLTSVSDASSPGHPLSGQETNPEYSGRSDRLCLSPEFSLRGDPLMLSDPSQNGQSEEKFSGSVVDTFLGRNVMDGGDGASLQPTNDNKEVSGSIRTFGFRMEENASPDLMGAPNVIGSQGDQLSQSPDGFPDAATGHQPITPDDSHPEDSSQRKKVDAISLWIPGDYTLLLVGLALASVAAIAFVLYKKK